MSANLLLAVIVVWNVWCTVGAALFLYFAYRRYDVVTRRFPLLTVLQLACLNLWENGFFSRTNLRLEYAPPLAFMTLGLTEYLLQAFAIPLFLFLYGLKALSLTNELFAGRRMMSEALRGKDYDWTVELTRTERRLLAVQTWLLTTRGHGDVRAAPRRYQAIVFGRAIALNLAVSAVFVPLGMLAAGCFDDDAAGGVGFARCLDPPYSFRLFMPMYLVAGFYVAFIFVLARELRRMPDDPHHLRRETYFNYAFLFLLFVGYLTTNWAGFAFYDPARGDVVMMAGMPVMSVSMIYFPVALCVRRTLGEQWVKLAIPHTREAFQHLLTRAEVLRALMKILAQTCCLENGLFWMEYQHVERTWQKASRSGVGGSSAGAGGGDDKDEALRRLYTQYIKPESPRELNLHHSVRAAVTRQFRDGALSLATFQPVVKEVFDMMYLNAFPLLIRTLEQDHGELLSGIALATQQSGGAAGKAANTATLRSIKSATLLRSSANTATLRAVSNN